MSRLRPLTRRLLAAAPLALAALTASPPAEAFCGFYVSGAGAKLFNNATLVVMMREGMRTVLSMQNNYQGPPEDFAMVVPVPVVLQQENVKTLPRDVFDRVDQLASPRLVEYWEQDPCYEPPPQYEGAMKSAGVVEMAPPGGGGPRDLGVKVEAKFTVGEYEIVILSANDSSGLDTWLRQGGYKIPEGAEPLLRPYVQAGSKFFVAKVNAKKVRFEGGMAMLSPLRFHYDTDQFSLPVRLGLMNSSGTQDLIVHVLARGKRYELANYRNVTIPTNLDVDDRVREQFGAFYAALFDRTVEQNPGAIVTEYAWGADSCDPCPSSPLDPADFATLGGDVMPSVSEEQKWMPENSFVLTRLHARYSKESLGEDLVFKEAHAIIGGREEPGPDGRLDTGARDLGGPGVSTFQARYAIRHAWTGAIECSNPRRGVWGGPPPGLQVAGDPTAPKVARDLAFAPRGAVQLAALVRHDVPAIGLKAGAEAIVPGPGVVAVPPGPAGRTGCACAVGLDEGAAAAGAAAGIAAVAAAARRRRKRGDG